MQNRPGHATACLHFAFFLLFIWFTKHSVCAFLYPLQQVSSWESSQSFQSHAFWKISAICPCGALPSEQSKSDLVLGRKFPTPHCCASHGCSEQPGMLCARLPLKEQPISSCLVNHAAWCLDAGCCPVLRAADRAMLNPGPVSCFYSSQWWLGTASCLCTLQIPLMGTLVFSGAVSVRKLTEI